MDTLFADDFVIDESTLPLISGLCEKLPGGFFIYHADGYRELIYFNRHMVTLFGCASDEEFKELTGNSFMGIVHPDDYRSTEESIKEQIAASDNKIDHVVYRYLRKDGSVGVLDDYGFFSHSDSFGDVYYVFAQDITDQYFEERARQKSIDCMMLLEDDFESLYDVDLETGEYEVYFKNQTASDEVNALVGEQKEFFADTRVNAELVVHPEDREGFLSVVDRDFIREALDGEAYFDWYYRLVVEDRPTWCRLRIVYKDETERNVIIGIFNAEEEMAAKSRIEQVRKDQIAKMAGGVAVCIINPETGRFQVLSENEYLAEHYRPDEDFRSSFSRYIQSDVYEPDRAMVAKAISIPSIMRHLAKKSKYTVRYRDISTGVPRWYVMRAVMLSESEILIGFSDKDAKVVGQQLYESMRDSFFGLYYVNLDDGLAKVMKTAHPELTGGVGDTVPYASLLKGMADRSQDKTAALLNRISDVDYIKRFFADHDVSYEVYKSYIYEGVQWVNLVGYVLARHEDGTPSLFGLGFSMLDEEACAKQEAKLRLEAMTEELEKERQKLKEALASADEEKLRNDILHDIIQSGKWAFYVNADDVIVGSDVSNEANTIIRNDVEADGRSWLDIVHPDDRAFAAEAFNATIKDRSCKTPYDVNYRMIDRNGEYRWFHSAGRIMRDEEGFGEFFGIHVDITEQMEEQQKRLLGAVPLSPDVLMKANIGLWAFELDEGQPPRMYGDETMIGLVGLDHQVPPEEMYHTWYDFIDEGSYDLVTDAVAKMSSGEHAEVQYPWHHPDGHTMIVRCGGVRNFEYTKGIRIEGTHQDVSATLHYDEEERRREEQQRKDELARVAAESANKAKTEFLFNMSHDIRTPMNAILGYTNVALNHIDEPARVDDSLKKIKMSGGHLLNLINDILEMSRIEAGKFELAKAPMNVTEVTEGVKAMSQALAATKDITFNAVVEEMKNPYVFADELHTNQVIINLVSNAIKYTDPGGVVEYRIGQLGDVENGIVRYRITVSDNGIGMTDEFQKHLFESFSREDSADVAKREGTGLGLAIVKRIVDISGGTISVQSTKGVGSTFVVELPLEAMDDDAIRRFKAERSEAGIAFDDSCLAGKRVLLVEDNELNREIAIEILEEEGLLVEDVNDGSKAVELLQSTGPAWFDFILMDIQMPVMDGYEATRAIRAMYPNDHIPIIALSANAFAEDKAKSRAAGMDDHVAKPIDVSELLAALVKFL